MEHEAEVAGLRQRFKAELRSALSHKDVQALRDRFLGRKAGLVTALYGRLATLEADAKRAFGKVLNELKQEITSELEAQDQAVRSHVEALPRLDPTLAGRRPVIGHVHPLTYLRTRIEAYFAAAGYEILDGPETEDDYHNFEALNLPADHPARDMQDTLYLERPWTRAVFKV
jgi:phenylalanyl-tRNA synthetase alpha chain